MSVMSFSLSVSSFGAVLSSCINGLIRGRNLPSHSSLWSSRTSPYIIPGATCSISRLLNALWDGESEKHAWNGILLAVPKKKTSHMKKRHRQMAGKALSDITALNKCSACGRTKRAHVLCPYCVNSIRQWFSNGFRTQSEPRHDAK